MSYFCNKCGYFGETSEHENCNYLAANIYWKEMQLEAELSATKIQLEAAEDKLCDQCNGDGWQYNAVEGRVPCVCVTELEAYQLLQEEKESLEKKLASAQAWRQSLIDMDNRGEPDAFIIDCLVIDSTDGTEELTKLLTAARQQGFEEGSANAGFAHALDCNEAFNKGKQAGRDELKKELSEQEPIANVVDIGERLSYRIAVSINNPDAVRLAMKLYTLPPIPPDLAELQRDKETAMRMVAKTTAENHAVKRENAELRRQLNDLHH